MTPKITVLLVEKDPQRAQLLLLRIAAPAPGRPPFAAVCVDGPAAARRAMKGDPSIRVVLHGSGRVVTADGSLEARDVARALSHAVG